MSSLLQNIKRNIRSRRGPTSHSPSRKSHSPSRGLKGIADKDKGVQNDLKGPLKEDKGPQKNEISRKTIGNINDGIHQIANFKEDPKVSKDSTKSKEDSRYSKTDNKWSINNRLDHKPQLANKDIQRSKDELRDLPKRPPNPPNTNSSGPQAGQGNAPPARKVSLTPPEPGHLEGRPARSRSAFAAVTNGGTFEDSGVDLDSSQGGASLTSDVVHSPLHSRDSSHISHVGNPRATSAFVHQGKLIQTATAKLSPDYMCMNGRGEVSDSRDNVVTHHVREISQSSSRSTNSSGSSKSSHKGEKRQHQSPSALSQSQSHTAQEEVYVKMTDFEREGSLSPPHRQEAYIGKVGKEKSVKFSNVEDHEYVNLQDMARDSLAKSANKLPIYPQGEPTSIDSNHNHDKSKVKNETSLNHPKDSTQQIQVQVHSQPISQVQSTSHNFSNLNQRLSDHNRAIKHRKPMSEESDLESNSESVTSQEVAVLTAISRRRRGQHMFHKHTSFPNNSRKAKEGEKENLNKSLVSFAEQSILSFLSHLDANSESESETNPATRCEHATRNFIKTSPTPTNISSDAGGSPVRTDAATPTNENPGHTHPTLHQIVAAYDLVSLTLSKTGYNYPHYGIHVSLQKFRDHLSPPSERSISSRNSSKISKSGSVYTPPGGFADDYMLPTVMAIDQDGVAGHDGRIRSGDYIIEINGTSVSDKSADETETLLNSEDMLHLVTTRGRSAIR